MNREDILENVVTIRRKNYGREKQTDCRGSRKSSWWHCEYYVGDTLHDQIKICSEGQKYSKQKEVEKIPGIMGVNIAGDSIR